MTNREIQKSVKQFKKKFGLLDCDLSALKKATEAQGYTIVEFNHISNDKSVQVLLDSLGLSDYATHSKGFTYTDKNYRIVFIHEDLNQEERTKVLAHENGHIFLNHFSSYQTIGKDVLEEYDANEFAHYLLNNTATTNIANHIKRHTGIYIATTAFFLVSCAIAGIIFFSLGAGADDNKNTYKGEYYLTSTGNKYHKSDCIYIKNKNNTKKLTEEEYKSGNYDPCGICLPE